SHVTDLTYVRLQGTDYLPEMYYGRFSVSSATELTTIINKTLMFEKTTMPDLGYLGDVVMIAGADASYAPTYGNGQINYGTTHYFNPANGIDSDTYLYPASASSDAQVIANANEGRGYMNYTAHGSQTSWADPTFTVTNVNAMTNINKYGVWVGNCCLTNAFNYSSPCFGEALIRKANGGAVAYIGGTNNTYWNEDYWWGIGYKTPIQAEPHPYSATSLGTYDAMFHTHAEAFTDWATTVGEANYMGNLAVQQSGSSRTNYYWEIYSIMGDPSLMPYFGVPTANAAVYPGQIYVGQTTYAISGAAPHSRIGLTMNGVTYGTGITDASGNLILPITPFTTAGTAKLVITAQNKVTVIADIPVLAASGPFLTVEAVNYDDDNNDQPDYNESGWLDVTFKNVGIDPATNVSAVLSCTTPGITITDANHAISSLAAGATVLADNAFSIAIADNIANGTVAAFTITMTMSGQSPWTYNFTKEINAPALAFGNMTVSDPSGNNNGRLDPGETVSITMPLNNTGGSASPSGSAFLTSSTPGITINTGTANFPAISASGAASLSFSLTADPGISIGTVASLSFSATAGTYTASKTENVNVGIIIEDFETGNFSSFPWIQGTFPWTIDNTTSHAGTYSAKSGLITHNQSSTLETTRVLSSPGTLTFWYKVSSESGYDYLRFYVDGALQGSWSGTVDWTQASIDLATGTRVLKWEYMKDVSVDSGSDCAWVDDIIFPASTAPSSFYPPQNLTAIPGNGFVNLAWQAPLFGTPSGYRIYRNGSLLTTVSGLSYSDTNVVNETTYGYYLIAVYPGGLSDTTETVTATPTAVVVTSVIIGTGTSSNSTTGACPVNQYYRSLHGQSVYTAAELNALGVIGPINITQIGFNITGLPAQAMPNFVVRMGHTTATNVASWISTGLTQVWSAASYQPTATGYNMLTLTTPFEWNGTDNIVVDTAFGMIGSWNSSGTTQYTTVTNGYRYGRSDTVDQTNVFTSGYTSTSRPNLKLTLLPNQSGPQIEVDPSSIAFGNVAVGASSVEQFTIQNSGNEILTGTISTPNGYSVAEVARSSEFNLSPVKNSRNTLGFSITPGATKTYNLTFAPTAAAGYIGNVVISSNDTDNPTLNLSVSGNGFIPNNPPTIDLPASFSFDKNGSLIVDMGLYTNDQDGDPLTLDVTGNSNVLVSITGLTVTFTATQNWIGTENLTFTVSDGEASAFDTVMVTVNQVSMPDWTPVTYPNNSATVYGVATIDWTSCVLNDVVGAFVGTECRGMAEVTVNAGVAYVTLLVNLASEGETVSFKIYDYSADTAYPVLETYALNFGQVIGDTAPIAINAVTSIELDAPEVSIEPVSGGTRLFWPAVELASEYHIYRASEPYGVYAYLASSASPEYTDPEGLDRAFYYVKAIRNLPSKGMRQ
ncbi:MAG: hypothetical protein K0B87_08380, partial [Candidatus Syntrophosphaera sp.]|nr:hypothetical protein [Candidatus Syntrophosphaera sp.]